MQISSCCSELGRGSKMQRQQNKESPWFTKASPPKPWQAVGAGDPWNHSCRQSPFLRTEGSLVPSYLRTPFLLQGSFDFVRGFFPPPLPGSFLPPSSYQAKPASALWLWPTFPQLGSRCQGTDFPTSSQLGKPHPCCCQDFLMRPR